MNNSMQKQIVKLNIEIEVVDDATYKKLAETRTSVEFERVSPEADARVIAAAVRHLEAAALSSLSGLDLKIAEKNPPAYTPEPTEPKASGFRMHQGSGEPL